MSNDAKSNFNFSWLIILSIFFLSLDILISFYAHPKFLGAHNINFLIEILFKLKRNKIFGNHFILKTLIFFTLIIPLILNNQNKKLKKNKEINLISNIIFLIVFLISFLFNHLIFKDYTKTYLISTIILYFFVGYSISKIITYAKNKLGEDRFNKEAKKFKQEKKLMQNQYSVNLKTEDGYINVINPFRAVAVMGTPGSGKTFAILLEAIKQSIEKGYSMFLYDFKFPDLTEFAYNVWLKNKDNKKIYPIKPKFTIINFDDIERSHRANPLQPDLLLDFTDAVESAKSILLGLNKSWLEKQGDFFVESPINFLAICIWALKKYENGKYCSLPHVIQLVSSDYELLFPFLQSIDDQSIKNVLAPFSSALEKGAYEQLEGQIASVRLSLTRLTSPLIYYTMTTGEEPGENVSLQINDPKNPQIFCIGNNPDRQEIYGACISLYTTRLIRLVNKKNKNHTALIMDELPTVILPKGTLDNLIATGRSNKIAVWLGFQDLQQLIRDYGEKNANAIFGTIGNLFTGMITGNTAQKLSKRFGKIKILKESYSISKGNLTQSQNEEMQDLIPASELATLQQGMFAGQVADNFGEEIEQKFFYSKIKIDIKERKKYEKYKIPKIFDFEKAGLNKDEILEYNFKKIVSDIDKILEQFKKEEELDEYE